MLGVREKCWIDWQKEQQSSKNYRAQLGAQTLCTEDITPGCRTHLAAPRIGLDVHFPKHNTPNSDMGTVMLTSLGVTYYKAYQWLCRNLG